MKIRQGFVSNSSSSSFVIATSIENHENIIEEFDDKEKNVIMKFMCKIDDLFGRKMIIGGDLYDLNGNSTSVFIGTDLGIDEMLVLDIWEKYLTLVQGNKEETIYYNL